MNCYLDSSALVKRYLVEPGASEVIRVIADADKVGTVAISRAEVVAALAKATRFGTLLREEAESVRHLFQTEWRHLSRFRVTDLLVDLSCDLAWRHGLRGYDSVQLAAASLWQEAMDAPVVMVTFDVHLWNTAARVGLEQSPQNLPQLLESWRS
jgi:predicted nucleic acid-binding protein